MGKYLNVGNAGFASVLRGIYIDKTEMISYINKALGQKIHLPVSAGSDALENRWRPRCFVHIMTGAVFP